MSDKAQPTDVELGQIGMTAPPTPPAPPASGPAKSMTAFEVIDSFIVLDQDKDGHISHDEFIAGLKANWQIAESYFVFSEIYGRTIRWHHGDAIRFEGGVGGLVIPMNKAIAQWNKGRKADLDCFGHHHTYLQTPNACSNGSMIGFSPFSVQIKAGFEPPTQTMFLMDSKRGRTAIFPLFP